MIAWDEGAVTSYTPRSVHRVKCRCGVRLELDTDGVGHLVELESDGSVHNCPGPQLDPLILEEVTDAWIASWRHMAGKKGTPDDRLPFDGWTADDVLRHHGITDPVLFRAYEVAAVERARRVVGPTRHQEPHSRKKLTDWERRLIVRLYQQEDLTVTDIARETGRSVDVIWREARAAGLPKRRAS